MLNLNLINKTICVTGANGVIGSKVVEMLLNYDCNIKILSRRPYYSSSKKLKAFIGDLSNPKLDLGPFVQNCDYLINCAAELQKVKLMRQVNVQSVYRLLSAIKKNIKFEEKKVHWIQLSSCGVYGSGRIFASKEEKFVNEHTIPNPQNEYEKTKLAADKILIALSKKDLIDYTIIRPSNVISENTESNIFYKLSKLIKKRLFLKNSKNSIATYVHIDDLVNSIFAIICNPKSKNNTFNLSLNCSWNKIFDKIGDLNKVKLLKFSLNYRVLLVPLIFLRFLLGNLIYIPTLRTFELKIFFSSTKIEKTLNFKFKKLLPDNIEKFFLLKNNTKEKISLSDKKFYSEKLNDLTIQTNNDILVSVVMSVYNGEKYLAKSIQSILCQTLKNFEFIIVNDGSTDSSLKIIQDFCKKDNRIKIIDKSNSGITHSLNCGIDAAKGNWIARIDADDISDRNRLMEQYLRGAADDSLALIGSSCFEIDKFDKKLKYYNYPESHEDLKNNLVSMKKYFPHSSYFIRTKLLKKINGYNLRMIRSQDYDLSLRLSDLGNIASVPKPLIFLRRHNNSISFNDRDNKGLIYPRLSLVNYYLNKSGLSGPLDSTVSKEDFLRLHNIIKEQYNLNSSNIFSIITKMLINKNRYNFFSNQLFSIYNKNEILDRWFKSHIIKTS